MAQADFTAERGTPGLVQPTIGSRLVTDEEGRSNVAALQAKYADALRIPRRPDWDLVQLRDCSIVSMGVMGLSGHRDSALTSKLSSDVQTLSKLELSADVHPPSRPC